MKDPVPEENVEGESSDEEEEKAEEVTDSDSD